MMEKICSTTGCNRMISARGLCHNHYELARCHGTRDELPRVNFRHGNSSHPYFTVWNNMRTRCNNPKAHNYKWYGALGVRVCSRWNNLGNFVADMGERPKGYTLDRTDPTGNYEPDNCRWVDAKTQANNKRANYV